MCVCHHLFRRHLILHNPQVLRRRHFLTASITSPLYSSRGQRPVFLRCPTKLRKTGGSIQGRYLPFNSFQRLNKLSNPVFRSKRLMQSNKLFNTFNYTDFFTFRFVHLSVSSSQGGLHSDPSSCEQPSKCVSPQSPTEGCGVIPVEGRCMCIDPDPGEPILQSSSLLRNLALQSH